MKLNLKKKNPKKSIVITTISKPNRCLKSIANNIKNDFNYIVIGDKKSPKNFKLKNCKYFSITDQKKTPFKSAKVLEINHYSRKNIGYLEAFRSGSELIYETDDDNLPYKTFYKDHELYTNGLESEKKLFVNIYKYFSNQNIWPRGFPLRYLKVKTKNQNFLKKKLIQSPIKQFLADGEPDVDAIFRLIFNSKDFNKNKNIFFLRKNSFCPFNSQNTVWHRVVFPLMYLPVTCSYRLTDIYRSYVAQRILWENNFYLSFHPATVRQIRNKHDLIEDFIYETDSYIRIDKLAIGLKNIKLKKGKKNLIFNLKKCYQYMVENSYLKKSENKYLNSWISDIKLLDEDTYF